MKCKVLLTFGLCLALMVPVLAHDLYLKPETFFAKLNEKLAIGILNGTFSASEGAVDFARLRDVSVVPPLGTRVNPAEADFSKNGTTSFLNLEAREPGTYVVGLSTVPREINLEGKDFNEYLAHDGIPDTLAEREKRKELGKKVRERYSKHVKTIFQAGDTQTDSYKTVLGYPVELVPRQNPYKLKVGDVVEVLCLKDGKPIANQFVMSGHEAGRGVVAGQSVRTDKDGIARIRLDAPGKWYVRFVNMTRLADPALDYESKWATLTFGVR